ncbi:MAG TPA: ImcF-related family protein [Bryobacteraceae bacterium]|nr:ImcF-related family protein [Bryobacteraceae bacterium]
MLLYGSLTATLIALIVLVVILFLKKRKEKKAAAAAAAAGGEVVAPGGDEISVLIHEAETKLAAAKLEQGGKVAGLPVFLIMGEPGTTKTSVMLHSGLEPELLAGQVYQAGNVAPTRSVNFWFSRRAIFAEAGGPMIADPGRWAKLVKKLQPRGAVVRKGEQAPRAALVCFDCENFTKSGAPEIASNAARNLRARLGEISQGLGINLPVYALFTKTDRLPFFTDFVRNLTNEESTQVLGVTLPMLDRRSEGVYAEEETARLTGQFERLFRSLADARIEFLAREGDANKLPTAYEFPRAFRKVRPALVQFLVDLCRPSQLTVGPFLRGFYFAGVRPVIINEMAPVEAAQQSAEAGPTGATGIFNRAMMANAARQAAARPQVVGTRKVPQWLFLAHLFNDILLVDRAALGASGASAKTSTARRWMLLSGSILAFLLLVMFTISFFNNRGLENDVREAAIGISSVGSSSSDVASLDVLRRLDRLRESLVTLRKYHNEGSPWLYRWFLYIGEDLYRPTKAIYFDRFRLAMFGQTQNAMLANLRSLPGSPVPDHEYQPTYDCLKGYLMTTSNHDRTTKLFLTPTLTTWWTVNKSVDPERLALAQKQFDFYAEELKEENPYSSENDGQSVERARSYLKQYAGTERVYNFMLAEADKSGKSVQFNRDFPGSAAVLINNKEVRGAFTAGGRKFMTDAIGHADRYFNGETWVLGDPGPGNINDRAQLERDLKGKFDNDWVQAWIGYINAAAVVRYSGLKDAANKLKQHSSNLAPLLEMSSQASQNTNGQDSGSKIFQPVRIVTPPEITDRYVGASNQGYITALAQLQSAIDTIADKPQPNESELASALQVAKAAETSVTTLSLNFNADSPIQARVQKLLTDPIVFVEPYLKPPSPAISLNQAGKQMCAQITPIFNKYPFKGSPEAPPSTLQEFDSVFKPKEGIIWQFYDQNLAKILSRSGTHFVPIPGSNVNITPAFLNFLNHAGDFTEAAYQGGTGPKFNYQVKPELAPEQQSIKVAIDGNTVVFTTANAAPKPFTWPGPVPGTQMSVTFQGGKDFDFPTFPGLWSVFNFVARANKRMGDTVEFVLTSGVPPQPITNPSTGQPVTVRLTFLANPQIFMPGYFSFTCVSDVAK